VCLSVTPRIWNAWVIRAPELSREQADSSLQAVGARRLEGF